MKKLFSCIIALTLMATFAFTTFASDNFVPSIAEKDYPEIVVGEEEIAGVIVDGNGAEIKELVNTDVEYEVVVTPIASAATSTLIPEDAKQVLIDQYGKLTAPNAKLSELCPVLNGVAEDALGEGKNADNLVIREFFDVSVIGDDNTALLSQDNNKLVIKLKNGIEKDAFITGIIYIDGEWKTIETVNNGDGTVTCTLPGNGPVALLVEGTGGSVTPPPTGSGHATLIWGTVALISLAIIVVLTKVIISNKKNNAAA